MTTLKETHSAVMRNSSQWRIPLMYFVDDFRHRRDHQTLRDPFPVGDPALDAWLASTAQSLCREINLPSPDWNEKIPAHPWFVSGFNGLRAIALADSPPEYRLRIIFVLENFLSRA